MKTIVTFFFLLFSFIASFGQTWLQLNPVMNTTPAYVDCGNVTVGGTQLTVECWATGLGRYISKHSQGADVNYALSNQQFEITTGGIHRIVIYGANACSYGRHIAATYDGSTIKVYVNGNLIVSQAVGGTIATNNLPTRIGQYAHVGYWGNGSDPTFGPGYQQGIPSQQGTGYIDQVRIWNVARTQQQIQDNMFSNLMGNETGLLAYYRFNTLNNLASTGAIYNGTAVNCTLGTSIPSYSTTWTGSQDTNWFNCNNWTNGTPFCPSGTAIIPNTTNKPSITISGASAKTVTVEPGGRIDNSGRLTVCP